ARLAQTGHGQSARGRGGAGRTRGLRSQAIPRPKRAYSTGSAANEWSGAWLGHLPILVAEGVAHTANGGKEGAFAGQFNFAAKIIDVNLDNVGKGEIRFLPDIPAEHVTSNDGVFMPEEVFEDFKLPLGDGKFRPRPHHTALQEVHFQVTGP